MAWNLTDEMPVSGARRRFYPPVASAPPGQAMVRAVDRTLFTIGAPTYPVVSAADDRTVDVPLSIRVSAPAGGFTNEGPLPDPLIRLHAMDDSQLTFLPASGGAPDRLELKLLTFAFGHGPLVTFPKWWRRWLDAGCVPLTIIYENVDRAQIQTLLSAVAAPVDTSIANRVDPTHGVSFPDGVIQSNKAQFIADFLAGRNFIFGKAGAYIGTAAADPADATKRLLTLHVRYQDHTTADPHPMNPLELFWLLFGDDSTEATSHPLLLRIHEIGGTQVAVHPRSRRMLRRPPLRTSARVFWEGDQEINHHPANWSNAGSLGADRLYCNLNRNGMQFNRGNYTGFWKCNLLVHDLCVRSGFRVCVQPTAGNRWHFATAASVTNLSETAWAAGGPDRIQLMGSGVDATRVWGFNVERWLRSKAPGTLRTAINDAIQEEGRLFVVAGARARRFEQQSNINGSGNSGFASCAASLKRHPSGHIRILRDVRAEPQLRPTSGEGLSEIDCQTIEATGAGAVSPNNVITLPSGNFIRLQLVELHPGKDPDTVQGMRDLGVNRRLLLMAGTISERAARVTLTHNPDGTPRPVPTPAAPGRCCHDLHPAGNAQEINCP